METRYKDEGYFRRKYPRREFKKKIGVLFKGEYFITTSGEVGEGGISLNSEYIMDENQALVVTFMVPGGEPVSIRAVIKSRNKSGSEFHYGLAFLDVDFRTKRQIRSFVSSRTQRNPT